MASSERFGYEWDKYSFMDKKYEEQFKNWTGRLDESDFKDKSVLDAGCGMGRNSFWALRYGAKKLTAFDLDVRSVERAKKTLSEFKNAKVFLCSIYEIELENEFDIAFSIGVIHHLKDPVLGLKNMTKALKKGGKLLIWVYSYEGNEWIVKYVNPIRKHVTSKLPLALVHFLSYFCSIPLYIFVKIFRGPSLYLKQLSTFNFWHLHSIVFDQLIPEVANYWRKDEVKNLVKGLPLKDVKIEVPKNQSGWILTAIKA